MRVSSCKGCGGALDGRKRKAYCAECRPRKPERPRIDWEPILAADGPAAVYAERVTEEQDGIPPSSRDLFYFLVEDGKQGEFFFPNDLSAYTVLNRKTATLRDELRFPPLDDATRRISTRWRAQRPESIIAMIEQWVGLPDLTVGQPSQLWIAVEKRGLVPRMEQAFTEPYGIPVVPLGGFASQPLRAEVRRLVAEDGRPAHLFYAADFDPSGWFLGRSFATKSQVPWASVTRVALTLDQVNAYDIPPNPAPAKDSRLEAFLAETGTEIQVEVNALEVVQPGLLADLFWEAIEPHWDDQAYQRALAEEDRLRAEIIPRVRLALGAK